MKPRLQRSKPHAVSEMLFVFWAKYNKVPDTFSLAPESGLAVCVTSALTLHVPHTRATGTHQAKCV
jgi:hypothetical protein